MPLGEHFVYSPSPYFYQDQSVYDWLCRELYFAKWFPPAGSTVIDLGVGIGAEAVWLLQRVPLRRYVAVDTEPHLFPALVETSAQFPGILFPVPFAVGEAPRIAISDFNRADYLGGGGIGETRRQIPMISWERLLELANVERVDLLKMNVEGAETAILESLDPQAMEAVQRVIVSCHDFRASRGESNAFRTRSEVTRMLTSLGYRISQFAHGKDWADDWLFAERQ